MARVPGAARGITHASRKDTIDPETADLVQLSTHPGGNLHLDLDLDPEHIYYVVPGMPESLWRVTRSGGEGVLVRDEIPTVSNFIVLGDYAFVDETFEGRLHRIALDTGETTVFDRGTVSLAIDGGDLYFLEEIEGTVTADLYRAPGGDVDQASLLAEDVRGPILGFDEDWVYAVTYRESIVLAEIHRFAKNGSSEELLVSLGSGAAAALTAGRLVFTHADDTRRFVNIMDLDGGNRTIVGYLPRGDPEIEFLSADETFVYATKGFVMTRMRR